MKSENFAQRLKRLVLEFSGEESTQPFSERVLNNRTHVDLIIRRYEETEGTDSLSMPKIKTLKKLAQALGVSVEYLLHGTVSVGDDPDDRNRAVTAAVALRYPQDAIDRVLKEPANLGLTEKEWFARIQAYAQLGSAQRRN